MKLFQTIIDHGEKFKVTVKVFSLIFVSSQRFSQISKWLLSGESLSQLQTGLVFIFPFFIAQSTSETLVRRRKWFRKRVSKNYRCRGQVYIYFLGRLDDASVNNTPVVTFGKLEQQILKSCTQRGKERRAWDVSM